MKKKSIMVGFETASGVQTKWYEFVLSESTDQTVLYFRPKFTSFYLQLFYNKNVFKLKVSSEVYFKTSFIGNTNQTRWKVINFFFGFLEKNICSVVSFEVCSKFAFIRIMSFYFHFFHWKFEAKKVKKCENHFPFLYWIAKHVSRY